MDDRIATHGESGAPQGAGALPRAPRSARRRAPWPVLWLVLLALLTGCAEDAGPNSEAACRKLLDKGLWDDAITTCGAIATETGQSLTAQAYMGRAKVSLLDLLDGLGNSNLQGLALILSLFNAPVGTSPFADVDAAVTILLAICTDANGCTETDQFNLTIASDVLLTSLLKAHLAISVDAASGALVIPGVTDTGIATLSSSAAAAEMQTVFANIYTNNAAGSGSYYTTAPLAWADAAAAVDLERVSTYARANRVGAAALGLTTDPALASLSALAFADDIDNGQCGYAATVDVTNPGAAAPEPARVADVFRRRLNTSHPTADYLSDDLQFTLLTAGVTDTAKEWGGNLSVLPSVLLNPDFMGVNCGAGLALGAFSTCMGAPVLIGAFAAVTARDLTTAITCGGACSNFPVLGINGDPLTDESGAQGAAATSELADVLRQLYPVDNTATAPTGTTPAYACAKGDGLVHYREYDYYLRNFGQP